jgi:hypothetical protein
MNASMARLQATTLHASAELNAFTAWWLHELRETWVAASEHLAPQRSQHFVIDLSGSRGAIRRQGSSDPAIEFDCNSLELPELQQLWPQNAPAGARATVLLPESKTLSCELRLPPVADRDVAAAVELQLERKLPLPREQLYVDWRIRETLADRSRLIDVLVARRTTVDHVRESVRAWGWRLIAVGRNEADGRQRCNLLPPPTRRLSFDIGKRERYLAWSAATLLGVYATLVTGHAVFERASVRDELAQAHTQMARIDKQRAVLASESKPIAVLHELMAQPTAVDGLVAVSGALPRDSWIYQADIRALASGVSVQLEGYTPSSTTLLQALQGSGQLEAIELVEATSAGVGSGSERIEMKARMHSGAKP